jgi:hypothetical protein
MVYLYIVSKNDWNFKRVTIDYYMLEGWLMPLYSLMIIGLERTVKKTIAKQQSNTSNKNHMECANYTVSYIHCDRSHRISPYAKGVIWASSII